jgi:prepilin-type N-terminal cleavage/methylation domain-containing protein
MKACSARGFTLIELMVTVAVIALLAAVAVPAFTGQSHKSQASSEVGALLGEMAVRQDQYKLENGTYLATPLCPAAPSAQPQDVASCLAPGTGWAQLKIRLPTEKLRCTYETTLGTGTFNIVATCEHGGGRHTYSVTSEDSKIQSD